jgi:hypothetical protein
MVRGGTITADQSDNHAQSRISTHGQNSKTRHHNRSQKVRRENQQQESLGDPKTNAWAPPETKDNDDEEENCDDSENRFVQDHSQVIVKVIAVTTMRPLLNQSQSVPNTT